MSSNNTICVIGTYFGQFNNYFSLWLKSCAYNPKIDFYIFGDAEYKGVLPQNVRIEYMTLETVKLRAEKYLGFKVSLERPYKCCDFKPIYGAIFGDYISSYEYWGHCDFDMIFGDIFSFLEKNNYHAYDRFFNLGHLSFYRNIPKVFNYLKLDGSLLDGTSITITEVEFSNRYTYKYKQTIGGVEKEFTKTIIPTNESTYKKTILKVKVNLIKNIVI
mgnify:CR=1 FL=1